MKVHNDGGSDPAVLESSVGAGTVVKQLRKSMLALKGKFMDEESGKVKYLELKDSPEYMDYVDFSVNLKHINLGKSGFF